MPELPEVETVRRALLKRLQGRTLTALIVPRTTFFRTPPQGALDGLEGLTLDCITRRGKYLILGLSGKRELVLHLGMSGHLRFGPETPHTRLSMVFEEDTLRFEDPRRFGRAGCLLPELGPEPLDKSFDSDYLYRVLRKRRASLKAMLMDQRIVAGIGNIYATEALFAAGLRPARAAGRITRVQAERLVAAIKSVLARAVELGGSTLDDKAYLDPEGRPGRAQEAHKVYGRKTGACGHTLQSVKKLLAGRSSVYCPRCQK